MRGWGGSLHLASARSPPKNRDQKLVLGSLSYDCMWYILILYCILCFSEYTYWTELSVLSGDLSCFCFFCTIIHILSSIRIAFLPDFNALKLNASRAFLPNRRKMNHQGCQGVRAPGRGTAQHWPVGTGSLAPPGGLLDKQVMLLLNLTFEILIIPISKINQKHWADQN